MQREKEIREHFLQTGYQRLFEQARRKWESIGRVGGTITIKSLREEERRRLSGLFGKSYQTGGTTEIRLMELDQILRSSRWAVGVEELLALLTGQPLVSNKQRKERRTNAWDTFCDDLLKGCKRQETRSWWKQVNAGDVAGSKAVKMLFESDRQRAQTAARLCLRALDELPQWSGRRERLPVFANRLSGDPHALDAETPSGRWLYLALCDLFGIRFDSAAEWKREVFQEAGILADEVASYVTVLGMGTLPDDPWHTFFEQAVSARIPLLLPLAFFQQKVTWRETKRLYVVENPSVFQSLIDEFPQEERLPPLVCTSGQPSVAALRLLDAFAATGTTLYYSGDFDWKGIEIACSLQTRYRESFVAWRMSKEEYLSCSVGTPFEEEQARGVLSLEVPWDEELVRTMMQHKRNVYQESLLELLLEDLTAVNA
ncbi:TIGR02679 family protein [Tumebacillus flagellatus]|uniref:TIGR02679 family protein n=1 Tax=Tumebacillus flagellatus TaxID=1157490 RepID=A0A074LF94_9BACL|nr:TIGR02679 family protein [Tumebacillus flagellatus]KEO80916.1 hypothetical protein EL26_23630 [Tumebacillus flagellatus]